jgi:pimeloyl-ACP methyl ester carboxylesterase
VSRRGPTSSYETGRGLQPTQYFIEGQGPDLLLVHGFPDSIAVWRYQIPAFDRLVPDLRLIIGGSLSFWPLTGSGRRGAASTKVDDECSRLCMPSFFQFDLFRTPAFSSRLDLDNFSFGLSPLGSAILLQSTIYLTEFAPQIRMSARRGPVREKQLSTLRA